MVFSLLSLYPTFGREFWYLMTLLPHAFPQQGESVQAKAREAVRYLHSCLISAHPRVIGQTPADVSKKICLSKKFHNIL